MSEQSQHTPGPWKVVEHSWSDASVYPETAAPRICLLSIADEATEETQYELEKAMGCNARLIAAAPELLAACELIDAETSEFANRDACESRAAWDAIQAVRAAIAKAKQI